MQKEKIWTRKFITVFIVNFTLYLSMFLLIVTIANYVIESYNAPTSIAGFASSIFIIGVLSGRFFSGRIVTKFGAKKALLIGIAYFIFIGLFYFLKTNISIFIIIRFLQGIGIGFATTATSTIATQIIPKNKKGQGISIFSLSIILSTAIGPLIGFYLNALYGYISIFIFSTIAGTICLIFSFTLKDIQIVEELTEIQTERVSLIDLISKYFEPKVIPISFVTFNMVFSYSSILSFILLFATETGFEKASGFYFLAYATTVLITRPISGRIIDFKNENTIIYPAILVFSLGLLLVSMANSSLLFILSAIFIGLGYGNFQSTAQTIAIKSVAFDKLGYANSTYYFFFDLALGFGPLILGFIHSFLGFRNMYLALAIFILTNTLLFKMIYGKYYSAEKERRISLVKKDEDAK